MLRFFRSSGSVVDPRAFPSSASTSTSPDPRAVRYFALAARYNAAATAMGFLSLEAALGAGQLREVLRRAGLAEEAEGAEHTEVALPGEPESPLPPAGDHVDQLTGRERRSFCKPTVDHP